MSLPTLPFGGITIAAISLMISITVGGFGAYYELKDGVSSNKALVEIRKQEFDAHVQSENNARAALWKKLDESHKETRDDLKEIRNMLMVPPNQRARVFPNETVMENPAAHGQK